jgi:hypothetical protein
MDGAIYPFPAYQGAETLYIYIYYMDLRSIPSWVFEAQPCVN